MFLNNIAIKPIFGKPYVRAIALIDTEERLYSIGAALGHALRKKPDMAVKLLFSPNTGESKVKSIMNTCKTDAKKNLDDYLDKFGYAPKTFGDFVSYRSVENALKNEGIMLNTKEASKAYVEGNKKVKRIFDQKVDLNGIEERMLIHFWQGVQFGMSFPELTEKMYQQASEEDSKFWADSLWSGLKIPEDLRVENFDAIEKYLLKILASYASENYPELLEPLDLKAYLDT
jgi:hypothetical protein